jgi:hypothetical protein
MRPAALGVLFLMIGSLMLLHPASGEYSPTDCRVVALAVTVIFATGAPLCFSERRAKLARRLTIFASTSRKRAVNCKIPSKFRITKGVANLTAIRRLADLYLKVKVACHGTRYNTTWYQTERTYCLITQPAKLCVPCMRHLSKAKGSFDKTVCPRNPAVLIEC